MSLLTRICGIRLHSSISYKLVHLSQHGSALRHGLHRTCYAPSCVTVSNAYPQGPGHVARFGTSSPDHDNPFSLKPQTDTSDVNVAEEILVDGTQSPSVDITLVEKQLKQILDARKKFLNDADFSRVFYEKLSLDSALPDQNLMKTYGDFVVLKVPAENNVNDFSTKLKSFNDLLGHDAETSHENITPRTTKKSKTGTKTESDLDIKKLSNMRQKNFEKELKCFLEACIHANLMTLARTTIIQGYFGTKRNKENFFKFKDVSIYNSLLQAYASQGRVEPVRTLIKMMSECQIAPDLHTHLIHLEALARSGKLVKDDVLHLRQQIRDLGHELSDIYQFKMTRETKRYVNEALCLIGEEPCVSRYVEMYDNPLVNDLCQPCGDVVDKNPYRGVMSEQVVRERLKQQIDLEMGDYVVVKSVWDKETPAAVNSAAEKRLKQWIRSCRTALRTAFDRNVKFLKIKAEDGSLTMYPYMKVLGPDEYVNLMIEEIRAISSESLNYSPSLNFLWRRLGQKVLRKYNLSRKVRSDHLDAINSVYERYWREYDSEDIRGTNHRVMWQKLTQSSDLTDLDAREENWPVHVVRNVGKFLFDIILFETKLTTGQGDQMRKVPAFYTIYRSYGQKTKQEIKPHPSLARIYGTVNNKEIHFEIDEVPMLVPPIPWSSIHYGGNLLSRTKFVRLPQASFRQSDVLNVTPSKQLNPVFDSLNTLSSCAWIINQPILDILLHVFRSGGDLGLDIPTPPDPDAPLPNVSLSMPHEEKRAAYRERMRLKRQRAEMYSLWCNELYRLSIANQYRNSTLWFPHNMDFRGRVYPTPPHFNHLGSDVVRSLLLFAKGKSLGKNGLDWLKIHLINLTGTKKRCSNQERLEYANEILDDILDSARKPMDGRQWWRESEEPWQTLACCMEVAKAVESENPEEYVCHYPVHQDGSFNGLQHYAALGRDKVGAESVNLTPQDRPCDVYSDVAELVEKIRQKDAMEGVEIAKALDGFIRRKVIKQTVMTTVYGITKYGAKYQILRQLRYLDDFDQTLVWQASVYLTEKTFYCLREMFTATRAIQDNLVLYAQAILKYRNQPIEWTTPLGLPVVQPYNKVMKKQSTVVPQNSDEHPHTTKQKSAFPPNYIHSLDSTHMMLTSLFCLRAGITYVSVHDCYWTHPATVDTMNRVCREQFIHLHSQPILEQLSHSLIDKYAYRTLEDGASVLVNKQLFDILTRIPTRGNFDLNNVKDSVYFFS